MIRPCLRVISVSIRVGKALGASSLCPLSSCQVVNEQEKETNKKNISVPAELSDFSSVVQNQQTSGCVSIGRS